MARLMSPGEEFADEVVREVCRRLAKKSRAAHAERCPITGLTPTEHAAGLGWETPIASDPGEALHAGTAFADALALAWGRYAEHQQQGDR